MPPKGELYSSIHNNLSYQSCDAENISKNCPSVIETDISDKSVKAYEVTSTSINNKPDLTISTNNINNSFHSGYFYPTPLSPIYEPDTESACSSNHSSPLHLPLTNGFSTNPYTLYNNNNKYIEDIVKVPRDYSSKESSLEKSETKDSSLCSDKHKSDNINGHITRHAVESNSKHEDTKGDPDNSDSTKGSRDDKTQHSSMSFKSVLSAIQFTSSQKFTKLRGFQFSNSTDTSSSSSSITPPIITINNDAIISNPLKSRFMNQFKSTNTSKSTFEEEKEGERCCSMINFGPIFTVFIIHLALTLPCRVI